MPADTSVKYLHSAMVGAPTLSGTAGSLIALLDAVLVNGFGTGTVDSIVIAGGIATVTRSAGHPMEKDSVALISGATVSGGSINGEQKVLSSTTTTYTFDATGIPNQTATGTITHKLAPIGWTKPYSSTNLAAYKPSDVTATGCLLRIDDTNAQYARAVGYETMSDVNTGTGPFPTSTQMSGGLYWPKSQVSDASTRQWIVVGDGRIFYLMVNYSNSTSWGAMSLYGVFGDAISTKSGDAYGCIINGFNSTSFGNSGNNSQYEMDYVDAGNNSGALYAARSYTGIGTPVSLRRSAPIILGSTGQRSGASGLAYPNYPDGGIYLAPVYLCEHAALVFRGTTPGLWFSSQNIGINVFQNRDSISGVTGLTGRTLKIANSYTGAFLFDITGPWR